MSPKDEDWADALDAITAAPQYHLVLLENDAVRVLDTTVPPGHTVPLHTHCWSSVNYILSWSDFIRRDVSGAILLDSRTLQTQPRGAVWSAPLPPHTLENIGDQPIHVISVELKRAN
jgi:hypothetical protein